MLYKSPESFKQAVNDRLLKIARERQLPVHRYQARFLIERLLARVLRAFPQVIVKGGMAIDLRLENARTTKDLDLGLRQLDAEKILPELQRVCQMDFGDWLTFEIEEDRNHPVLLAEGMACEGKRLKARAILSRKPFFGAFGVDVALGEALGPPDAVQLQPLIPLALEPAESLWIPLCRLETHIAEKLHAYTLPRKTENSRVKDLPDLAILASARDLSSEALQSAIEQTYSRRGTHPIPSAVPAPPPNWKPRYANMALENRLPWLELANVFRAVCDFLDPLLQRPLLSKTWKPPLWKWEVL